MIDLQHVSKSFNGITVLDDISLKVQKGETIAILGSSGSGKTTLLNIILGLLQPDSGKIICDGRDITKESMKKRAFNIVFQDYTLFPNLSVEKNIVYGLRNKKGLSSAKEVADLIELLDLSRHLKKSINQLSGGQKQRVALARTLVMKPRILLLDEPLSALDGVIKENIKNRIKEIVQQFQLTTFIVTHDPEEALTMSDKILVLDQGRIVQFDSPKNKALKDAKLPIPTSLKDLANPIYKNTIAIPNINSSSTAWLMIQALIDTYGESEAKTIFAKILDNVGPNLEDSGSGPIKKLRTGEVAVGFGLRQQGIVDEKAGLPIKVVEVKEGNYLLTESVALLKHKTMNPNAIKVAEILTNDTRKALQEYYPAALYQGEDATAAKRFPKPLTLELLKSHQVFAEEAKGK
ncbi:MAG: ATP-binding cassette domain-containing protein [Pseudolactococcus laudensis]